MSTCRDMDIVRRGVLGQCPHGFHGGGARWINRRPGHIALPPPMEKRLAKFLCKDIGIFDCAKRKTDKTDISCLQRSLTPNQKVTFIILQTRHIHRWAKVLS